MKLKSEDFFVLLDMYDAIKPRSIPSAVGNKGKNKIPSMLNKNVERLKPVSIKYTTIAGTNAINVYI